MRSKKAQVGSTMTWFIAFLVVFFVMILFLGGAIALSAMNHVSGFTTSKDVKVDTSVDGNLDSQRMLMYFLDHEVEFAGNEIKMKSLMKDIVSGIDINNKREIVKSELDLISQKGNFEYILIIELKDFKDSSFILENGIEQTKIIQGVEMGLVIEEVNIQVRFYMEEKNEL
jgi:hypothetical protein